MEVSNCSLRGIWYGTHTRVTRHINKSKVDTLGTFSVLNPGPVVWGGWMARRGMSG